MTSEEIRCNFIKDIGPEMANLGSSIILDEPILVQAGCPRDARSLPHWQLTKTIPDKYSILYCEIENYYSLGNSMGSGLFHGYEFRKNLRKDFKRLVK